MLLKEASRIAQVRDITGILILVIGGLLSFGEITEAQVISSTTGLISDGNEITISGSGFGATGPNIVLYDNFESGTNGNHVNGQAATIGAWKNDSATIDPSYQTDLSVSGSKSVMFPFSETYDTSLQTAIAPTSSDAFLSYWVQLPAGNVFPGTGNPDGYNWKLSWLWGGNNIGYDLATLFGFDASPPMENWSVSCNNCNWGNGWFGSDPGTSDFSMYPGNWYRVSSYVHATNDATSHQDVWTLSKDANQTLTRNLDHTSQLYNTAGPYWDTWSIGSYGRQTLSGTTHPHFDDAYLSVGPGARARVEIGNANTYTGSDNLSLLTPSAWSNTSITATVRQGSFAAGSAYLYVTDASGNVNASGYPITIAGAPDTTPPSKPGSFSAATSTTSTVSLAWTDSTDNVAVAGYQLFRNGTQIATSSAGSTSFTATSLAASTAYTFGIIAFDAANNTSTMATTTASTLYNDLIQPAVSITSPTNGTTVSGTVSIAATSSDNVGVAGVQFKLDGSNLGTEDTSSPFQISWNTASSTNASHTLTAVARDAAGNSTTSLAITVTVDNAAPVISAATSTAIATSTATITWTTDENSDSQVEYGLTAGYGSSTALNSAATTSHIQSVSGLSPATLYHFRVRSRDSAGNLGVSGDQTFTTQIFSDSTPPSMPTGLTSTSTATTIALGWDYSTDNVAVAGYVLYLDAVFSSSTPSSSATFVFNGLSASTTFVLGIQAVDTAGNTSTLATTSARTLADLIPPTPPGNISVTIGTDAATLSWTSSIDNVGVAGYEIYMNGVRVATTTLATYTQNGLTPGTAYTFGVSSYDLMNNTSTLATINTTTSAASSGGGGGGGGGGNYFAIASQDQARSFRNPAQRLAAIYAQTASLLANLPKMNTSQAVFEIAAIRQTLGTFLEEYNWALSKGPFLTDLKYGMTNSQEVKLLQVALTQMGHLSAPITGHFYGQTLNAVKACQKMHGLAETGSVGPMLRAMLNQVFR